MRPTDSRASPRYHSLSSHWMRNRSAFSCSSFTTSEMSTLMVKTSASVDARTFVMARLSFLTVGWSGRTGARMVGGEGGTGPPRGCPTPPSNVRVCQFRHFGEVRREYTVSPIEEQTAHPSGGAEDRGHRGSLRQEGCRRAR